MEAYNKILIEFNFVVDLDLAIYKFFRENSIDNPKADYEYLSSVDEREIITRILNAKQRNSISPIFPDFDTDNVYEELMSDTERLSKYYKATDIFRLMVTLQKESSVEVTVLCFSQCEADYIASINPNIKCIVSNRTDVDLGKYDAIFIRYITDILSYNLTQLNGKNIIIAKAACNYKDGKIDTAITDLIGSTNLFFEVDVYREMKYVKEGE